MTKQQKRITKLASLLQQAEMEMSRKEAKHLINKATELQEKIMKHSQ